MALEVGLERLDVPKTAENYCFFGLSSTPQIPVSVPEMPSGTKAGPNLIQTYHLIVRIFFPFS